MEEEASTQPEVYEARRRFRIKMIRLSKFAEKQADPVSAVDLSNVPPHLAHKYANS